MFDIAPDPAGQTRGHNRQSPALRSRTGKQSGDDELAPDALKENVIDLAAAHVIRVDQLVIEQSQSDINLIAAHLLSRSRDL
jgi:hypothetical protein